MRKVGIIGIAPSSLGAQIAEHMMAEYKSNHSSIDQLYPVLLDCDVTSWDSISQCFSANRDIDDLVFAAGVYMGGKIADEPLSQWKYTLDVNLTGAWLVLKAFHKYMDVPALSQSIILIGASASRIPAKGSAAYDVSKAGMSMLTSVAALEMAERHTSVIQLDPGIIEGTGMWNATARAKFNGDVELMKRERLANVTAGRTMTTMEVYRWVEFLIKRGSYATGRSLQVDGMKMGASWAI